MSSIFCGTFLEGSLRDIFGGNVSVLGQVLPRYNMKCQKLSIMKIENVKKH